MNQSVFLHIVERLEGFLGKLPASIQKPVLHELTPLKELFLQQRAPRIVLTGSGRWPAQEIFGRIFRAAAPEAVSGLLLELHRWQTVAIGHQGTISLLDARDADEHALRFVREELAREPADVFLHLDDEGTTPITDADLEALIAHAVSVNAAATPKIIGVSFLKNARTTSASAGAVAAQSSLQARLAAHDALRQHLVAFVELPQESAESRSAADHLLTILGREVPNEARVEMARISRDRQAQAEIAQTLVKSTSAICTAVGAQPIPLADLPILTTLQLVMVSGIMYVSGRERSLRAATEFIGALGVNVGAGMVLREGARAVLKFFPGWGNVVCGMVAGAGTYAVGKAATVYFIENLSLQEARRTYLTSRKKSAPRRAVPQLREAETANRGR